MYYFPSRGKILQENTIKAKHFMAKIKTNNAYVKFYRKKFLRILLVMI